MTTITKWAGVIALVIVIAVGVKVFIPVSITKSFGAVGNMLAENYDPYIRYNGGFNTALPAIFSGNLTTGTSGTVISRINTGFCTIQASGTTITASSTKTVDCQASTTGTQSALTGVTAGDKCFLGEATTSPTTGQGLSVVGASASSTSGYITANIANLTGGTFTWTSTASSSWPYYCVN